MTSDGSTAGDRVLVEKAIAQDLLARNVSGAEPPVPVPEGYTLLECLGSGGAGVVYLAEQRTLRRQVALKFMTNARPADLERFRREARFTARLQNPSIVQVYELGESAGQPYIAMQFVDGGNLAQAELDPKGLVFALKEVSQALGHAHREGIIHRDIKPQNILLSRGGSAFLTDFGVARDLRHEFGATLSDDGIILGTPELMPPEQARGDLRAVDSRSDIYSLGATLYMMVTGRMPFEGPNVVDILHGVLHDDPPLPRSIVPSVPRSLEAIILRCMKKDKCSRYKRIEELTSEFDDFLKDERGSSESSAWFRKLVSGKSKPAPTVETDDGDLSVAVEIARDIADWDANLYRISANIPRTYPQLDSIIARLDQVLAQTPDLAWARFYRGMALFRRGQQIEALDNMELVIDRVGDMASAYFELGRLYLTLHLSDSLDARKHITQLGIDNQLKGSRGRLEQSDWMFQEAQRLKGNLPSWQLDFTRAVSRFADQDYAACILVCDSILGEDPDLEEVWKLRGDALRFQGEDPLSSYKKAIEIRRSFDGAHQAMGEFLFEQGQFDRARGCFRRVLEILPECVDALAHIGRTHLMEARAGGGEEDLAHGLRYVREAQEIDRGHYEVSVTLVEIHRELGLSLGKRSSLDEALEQGKIACELGGCQNRVELLIARTLIDRSRMHEDLSKVREDLATVIKECESHGEMLPEIGPWREVYDEAVAELEKREEGNASS